MKESGVRAQQIEARDEGDGPVAVPGRREKRNALTRNERDGRRGSAEPRQGTRRWGLRGGLVPAVGEPEERDAVAGR